MDFEAAKEGRVMRRHILSFGAAAGALLLAVALTPQQASALPGGTSAGAHVNTGLVQQVGSKRYYRHHGDYVRAPFTEVDTRRGTWVAAPFARVYSGRRGTWVRAPFVNLWVPR
jgi:hypothetical protein